MFNELVQKVDDYLDNYASLQQFKVWFYDLAFEIEKQYSGEFVDVVHEIEGILAEASSGNWPVLALDRELDKAVSSYRSNPRVTIVHVDAAPPRTFISSVPWELLVARPSAI